MRSTVLSFSKALVLLAFAALMMIPAPAFAQDEGGDGNSEAAAPPPLPDPATLKSRKRSPAELMKNRMAGNKGAPQQKNAPEGLSAGPSGSLKVPPTFKGGNRRAPGVQGPGAFSSRNSAQQMNDAKAAPGGIGANPNQVMPHTPLSKASPGSQGGAESAAAADGAATGSSTTAEDAEKKFSEFKSDEKYRIDYYDQDLIEFIKLMSEKFKVNFIMSDKIKGGKVTIVSPNAVTREEAWQAFLSVLESRDIALVKVGKFYKIIASKDAMANPMKTYLEGGETPASDDMITYIYKLKHIETADVDKILQKIKGKNGDIITFEPTSTFIITDTSVNIRRMVKIINELDLPSGRDAIHVIDIYYADAQEIADKLQTIFGDKGKGAATARKPTPRGRPGAGGSVSNESSGSTVMLTNVIADERTNQLIVVAPRDAMPKIVDMISRLDVPIPGDGQIHVYYCENANAEEMQQTLTGIAGKTGAAGNKKGAGGPKGGSGELFEGEVKINADKSTNSLVITASTKDFNSLKKVIQQLDIRRRQVFVEAVIMEITLKKDNQQGLAMAGGVTVDVGGETVPIYGGTTLGSMTPLAVDPTTLSGLAVGLKGPDLEGTEGIIADGVSIPSFGVILQMLQTNSDANVLSTPHILTTDNEEAEIIVGSNVPFITGQARDVNNRPVLSIQRQDVALTMKIKPQISESDFVRLEVQQEITELVSISETLGPTTTKRAAKSVVIVKDNQTIVIGGLLKDKETNDAEKVPFLGDLPILGRLFRRDKDSKEKTNLLIFLTPHVIEDEEDFRRVFKRKIDERNEFLRRFYGTDKDYEFDIDYSQKVGPVEAMRQKIKDQEAEAEKKRKEMEEELILNSESKNRVYEIGASPENSESVYKALETEEEGFSNVRSGNETSDETSSETTQKEPDSGSDSGDSIDRSQADELMNRMFNKPEDESE